MYGRNHCTVLVRGGTVCHVTGCNLEANYKANSFLPTQQMKPKVVNNQQAHNTKNFTQSKKLQGKSERPRV